MVTLIVLFTFFVASASFVDVVGTGGIVGGNGGGKAFFSFIDICISNFRKFC